MSQSWRQQSERGSPFALRLILWIALNLGRPTARLLLYPISIYFLFRAAEQRNASRNYLSLVLGLSVSFLFALKVRIVFP